MGTNENDEAKKGRVIDPTYPDVDTTGVKVGSNVRPYRFRLTKIRAFVLLVVVALAIGAVFALTNRHKAATNEYATPPTPQQARQSIVDELKKNPPKSSASTETKIAYYDNLKQAYVKTGDYKSATATFEKRVAISTKGLTYRDYIYVASYYHQFGDQTDVAKTLDAAAKSVPPEGSPQEGYTHEAVINMINAARQELGL